ncbi:MAG: ROK family protein [Calditrichaeota bacterium]|nr:ROK family protein [Calditrichota bacterium]
MNSTRLALGIDIGGTNLKVGLVTETGELIDKETSPTPKPRELSAVVSALSSTVQFLCEKHSVTPEGAGVGAPGVVDETLQTVLWAPNFPDWIEQPIRDTIADALSLPVVMDNDVNNFAVGEHRWGAARDFKHFVACAMGTGLGGAVFVDGKLYRGARGAAGEMGFTIIAPEGPAILDRQGVVEAYVGRVAFDKLVDERFKTGEFPTPRRITELAEQGESRALEIHDILAKQLSEAAATWLHILNPEAIIIGGGTAHQAAHFFERFNFHLRQRALPPHTEKLHILPGQLGYYAGMLGAAALWFEKSS